MTRITSKNTSPEIKVRKILSSLGCRYRLHVSRLSGKPDIVVRRLKTAFFVNGCFWHQHEGCKRKSVPKSNINYWSKKLDFNVKRQILDTDNLKKSGWNIIIIWECETKDNKSLFDKINSIYEKINHI